MSGGTEVSVLLTRLYAPSGDFAEPAYAARTSHWAASMKRAVRTSGCIWRIGDCGDNIWTSAPIGHCSPRPERGKRGLRQGPDREAAPTVWSSRALLGSRATELGGAELVAPP
jgi:hypothetical protein